MRSIVSKKIRIEYLPPMGMSQSGCISESKPDSAHYFHKYMKYSLNNYVQAFAQTVKTAPHEAVGGFIRLLKKTGDIKHSKKIIEAVHKKLVNEKEGKWVDVEVAREAALKKETFKHKFSEKDHLDFRINPELVAGVRITVDGERELNNSMQNKLNKLFQT